MSESDSARKIIVIDPSIIFQKEYVVSFFTFFYKNVAHKNIVFYFPDILIYLRTTKVSSLKTLNEAQKLAEKIILVDKKSSLYDKSLQHVLISKELTRFCNISEDELKLLIYWAYLSTPDKTTLSRALFNLFSGIIRFKELFGHIKDEYDGQQKIQFFEMNTDYQDAVKRCWEQFNTQNSVFITYSPATFISLLRMQIDVNYHFGKKKFEKILHRLRLVNEIQTQLTLLKRLILFDKEKTLVGTTVNTYSLFSQLLFFKEPLWRQIEATLKEHQCLRHDTLFDIVRENITRKNAYDFFRKTINVMITRRLLQIDEENACYTLRRTL